MSAKITYIAEKWAMARKRKIKPESVKPDEIYDSKNLDQLKFDTELLRMRLEAETGSTPYISEDAPLELQHFFLNNVFKFEKQINSTKEESISEILGNKTFKPVGTLRGEKLTIEFDKLMSLLNKNNIDVTWAPGTRKRTIYKFITEELILQRVRMVDMPGMMMVFPYEEFHPNYKHEATYYTISFLETLFNKDATLRDIILAEEIIFNRQGISRTDFLQRLNHFKDAFDEMHHFRIGRVKVKESKEGIFVASVKCTSEATLQGVKYNFGGEWLFEFSAGSDALLQLIGIHIEGFVV